MQDCARQDRRDNFVGNVFVLGYFLASVAEIDFNNGHESFERFKNGNSLVGSWTSIFVFSAG